MESSFVPKYVRPYFPVLDFDADITPDEVESIFQAMGVQPVDNTRILLPKERACIQRQVSYKSQLISGRRALGEIQNYLIANTDRFFYTFDPDVIRVLYTKVKTKDLHAPNPRLLINWHGDVQIFSSLRCGDFIKILLDFGRPSPKCESRICAVCGVALDKLETIPCGFCGGPIHSACSPFGVGVECAIGVSNPDEYATVNGGTVIFKDGREIDCHNPAIIQAFLEAKCVHCGSGGAPTSSLNGNTTRLCGPVCAQALAAYVELMGNDMRFVKKTQADKDGDIDDIEEEECSICIDYLRTSTKVTPCSNGHSYHSECWLHHVKKRRELNAPLFCAYCMTLV
jgi:hypothetical protein